MQRVRTLLADDHPVVRSGIRNLLAKSGDIEIVGEASSGVEALQLSEELAPDVLLLDMEMPGMTGLEVTQQLRLRGATVRILALSAHDDEQYIFGLLDHAAAGYLTKEEALTNIVAAVKGVAQGEEGWFSRRITAKVVRRREEATASALPNNTPRLTDREMAVLNLLVRAWDNQRIAEELNVCERTVKFHTGNIYQKLQVTNRTEAILRAISCGWVEMPRQDLEAAW